MTSTGKIRRRKKQPAARGRQPLLLEVLETRQQPSAVNLFGGLLTPGASGQQAVNVLSRGNEFPTAFFGETSLLEQPFQAETHLGEGATAVQGEPENGAPGTHNLLHFGLVILTAVAGGLGACWAVDRNTNRGAGVALGQKAARLRAER